MSKKKWESLPEFAKEAINQAATEEFGLQAARAFDAEDMENIEAGKAKGIEFHTLPPDEMSNVRGKIKTIWEDWVEEHVSTFPARAILDAVLHSAEANR